MQLGALEYLISLNSNNLSKDIKKADSKLTSWAVAKGQMISRVLEKAAATAADSVKQIISGALDAFGSYEQVLGGAKLMWGEQFDFIEKRARQAYRTVQMSATAYMEQANYFAVGLSEALGGDKKAAAELADEIISTQADIVAALGIDAERVQSAFAGLMRGNYTMLDNLGLGIAGTKAGMEEVIRKVNEYNKANGIATRYSMKSIADQQKALVEYAKMQGLAGYAAREGVETLQGSIASAGAAWQDLLSSIGSGQDVKGAAKRFGDAAVAVINNATPVIKRTIENLPAMAKAVWPSVKKAIGDIWKSVQGLLKTSMPRSVRQLASIGSALFKRLGAAFRRDGAKGLFSEIRAIGSDFKSSIAEWLKIDSPDDASWGNIGTAILKRLKEKINGETIKNLLIGDSTASWTEVAVTIATQLRNAFKTRAVGALSLLGIDTEPDESWTQIAGKILRKIKAGLTGAEESARVRVADLLGIEGDDDPSWGTIARDIIGRIRTALADLKLKIADLIGLEGDGDPSWRNIAGELFTRLKGAFADGAAGLKLKAADLLGLEADGDTTWGDIGKTLIERVKGGLKNVKLKLADLLGVDESDISWKGLGAGGGIGKKISDQIGKGLAEGGWIDTFLANFREKWEAILTLGASAITQVADWIRDNESEFVDAIVQILVTVANAASKIIPPLVNALVQIFASPDFINALTSLAGVLIDIAVQVVTSPDLWNALAVLADNVLRMILGDSAIDKILGKKKRLEYYTDESGKKRTRVSEYIGDYEKGDGLFARIAKNVFNVKEGGFLDRAITWTQNNLLATIMNPLKNGVPATLGLVDVVFNTSFEAKALEDRELWDTIQGRRSPRMVVSVDFVPGTGGSLPESANSWFGSPRLNFNKNMTRAKGDWNVPYDMYAQLHAGEIVLTKSQARRYRDGEGGMDYTVVGSMIGSAVEKAMSRVYVMMSGEKVGDLTTRRIRKNLNANSVSKLRALGG